MPFKIIKMSYFIGLLFLICAAVATLKSDYSNVTATCTITKYDENDIADIQSQCTDIVIDGIAVPAGVTLDLTKLQPGTKLTFRGTITWEYAEWLGPLVKIVGTNVEVIGADNHVLDGRGQLWWDGKGGNGGKTKPKFMFASVTNSVIHKLYLKNAPVQAFSVNHCIDSVIQYITIDDKDGDTMGGHNTDAFNVNSSNNVTIKHCTVYNQDDCMAMNSGYSTYFFDNYCSGGHGISIGSVGNGAEVADVIVSDCQIVDSDNGVRIKTKYEETGSVSNITYQNIYLENIHKYGIVIEGDYDAHPTGVPTGGVPISHLILKNITGTVDTSGANIYILVANASDWHWSDINVTGGEKEVDCTGIPDGTGVTC